VGARDKFDSNFMTDYISGKAIKIDRVSEPDLFYSCAPYHRGSGYHSRKTEEPQPRKFSPEAQTVFNAGKKLWQYYHAQFPSNSHPLEGQGWSRGAGVVSKCNVNASLYDIREYFQGRNDKGKMNSKSDDETYNELIANLRSTLKTLALKIEPKVYEYGFLKQ
jgi:hypothetical protein